MFQDTTNQHATDSTPECGSFFFFFKFKNEEATIAAKLLTDSFQRRTVNTKVIVSKQQTSKSSVF